MVLKVQDSTFHLAVDSVSSTGNLLVIRGRLLTGAVLMDWAFMVTPKQVEVINIGCTIKLPSNQEIFDDIKTQLEMEGFQV